MKEGGERKSILAKTLQRCRYSLAGHHHHRRPADKQPPPAGCFAVLVGPEKERFVVRARCASHPLFRALLEQAETEYGFAGCDGPLELPCSVDDFMEVMWEMEQGDPTASPGRCGRWVHLQMHQGYQMMSPARTFLVAGRQVVI
jgi:SAUR family protein